MSERIPQNRQVGFLKAFVALVLDELASIEADIVFEDLDEARKRVEYIRRQCYHVDRACERGTPKLSSPPMPIPPH